MGLFKKSDKIGSIEAGQYTVDLYFNDDKPERCYAYVKAGDSFELRINGNMMAYGLLLNAHASEDKDSVEAFCSFLALTMYGLSDDPYFVKDLSRIAGKMTDRAMKKGAEEAGKVTEQEDEANEQYMAEVQEIAEQPLKEKKKTAKRVSKKLKKIQTT